MVERRQARNHNLIQYWYKFHMVLLDHSEEKYIFNAILVVK